MPSSRYNSAAWSRPILAGANLEYSCSLRVAGVRAELASVGDHDRSSQREGERSFHRYMNIFLAGESSSRRARAGARARSNQSTSGSTCYGPDRRADACAASDQGPVTLLVASAFAAHMRRSDFVTPAA